MSNHVMLDNIFVYASMGEFRRGELPAIPASIWRVEEGGTGRLMHLHKDGFGGPGGFGLTEIASPNWQRIGISGVAMITSEPLAQALCSAMVRLGEDTLIELLNAIPEGDNDIEITVTPRQQKILLQTHADAWSNPKGDSDE